MFEVDHGNMPEGDEYREMRQFITSNQVRGQMEHLHCSSITVVHCDYRDRQSGSQRQGYFIARKDRPTEPVLLIAEKRGGKGDGLYVYEALFEGVWSNAVPVEELVH